MATLLKVLGTTDEVTACDCCGRTDLKNTVALEDEDGNVCYFGCVCASKAMKWAAKDVRVAARKADEDKRRKEMAERQAAFEAQDKLWQAFLDRSAGHLRDFQGKGDRFRQIEFLGGYAAASAKFKATCMECFSRDGHLDWCSQRVAA